MRSHFDFEPFNFREKMIKGKRKADIKQNVQLKDFVVFKDQLGCMSKIEMMLSSFNRIYPYKLRKRTVNNWFDRSLEVFLNVHQRASTYCCKLYFDVIMTEKLMYDPLFSAFFNLFQESDVKEFIIQIQVPGRIRKPDKTSFKELKFFRIVDISFYITKLSMHELKSTARISND